MESQSSETVDNMPTHATDTTPMTLGGKEDATGPSLVHGNSAKQYTAPIEADAQEYKMNHEKRGRAIIFNHEKYNEDLGVKDRPGTNVDKICLKQRFEELKFDVEVFDDLILTEIENKLTKISTDDHKNEDCLVVVVLTHGEGEKELCAYDKTYRTDTLWSHFKADVCPELAGKPKIFIIQACRGEKASESMQFQDKNLWTDGNKRPYSIPVEADQLVAFSTYEGCVAFRETADGTWFIQEFCKELEDNGEKVDLLTLFTNVNRRVAVNKVTVNENHQQVKQMPVVQSTLTRKLFFSSTAVRSMIPITPHVTRLVRETNEKLDCITEMLQDMKTSLSVSKVKPTRKQSSSLSWKSLHSSKQTMTHPMPQGEAVYKLADALKMFLEEEAHRLKNTVKKNGELILSLLTCWENFNEELKWYGYKILVVFLNEHAKNWRTYRLLDVPDSSSISGQQCHLLGSEVDVPKSRRSAPGPYAPSRQISSTSKSNPLNYR